jgi:hypothetical protein
MSIMIDTKIPILSQFLDPENNIELNLVVPNWLG